MKRASTALFIAFAAVACATPTLADHEMVQSPLLMRRAGPSCQPGNLEGEPGAGIRYRLGPCAGPDSSSSVNPGEIQRPNRRR